MPVTNSPLAIPVPPVVPVPLYLAFIVVARIAFDEFIPVGPVPDDNTPYTFATELSVPEYVTFTTAVLNLDVCCEPDGNSKPTNVVFGIKPVKLTVTSSKRVFTPILTTVVLVMTFNC